MIEAMKRSVTISLSDFALKSLIGRGGTDSERVRAKLEQAIRLYLGDRDAGHAGWAYPSFLHDGERGDVELELEADEGLLLALEEQAGMQGASVSQLAAHAALYYAAELDAGNLTQRILDELDAAEN